MKTIVKLLALLACAISTHAGILTGPITNTSNGHVYYLLSSNTWGPSEFTARLMGGHLATIRNATEQNWIYNTFSHYLNTNRNLWIGLYDTTPTSNAFNQAQRRTEFHWISGDTNTYANWSPYEPNNPASGDTNNPELYGHIWNPSDPYSSYWNNYGVAASEFGIELDGVVEIVPPVNPLQVSVDATTGNVTVYCQTVTNKSYQLLSLPDLLTPFPTNLMLAIGASGQTNYVVDTTNSFNGPWTNFGTFPGSGGSNGLTFPPTNSARYFRVVTFP